jgi:23S rRNA (guanosine2251-2'-O)-methyltransferase
VARLGRILFGRHAVREALSAARLDVHAVYVLAGGGPAEVVELAKRRGVTVEERGAAELLFLAESERHQGIVAVVGEYAYVEPEALVERARAAGEAPLLVALDCVQDPQNLGAIVRSASFFGAQGVLLPRDRAAHVTGAVVRASAGATERTAVALCTNLVRTLEEWKRAGIWVVGAAAGGGRAPAEVDLRDPVVLCIGSEGRGLRPLVLRACDHVVTLPAGGRDAVAALNASAAAAALLYEVRRQRSQL